MIRHALTITGLCVGVACLFLWHRLRYDYAEETKGLGDLNVGRRWRDTTIVPDAFAVRGVDARRRRAGGVKLRSDTPAKDKRREDGEAHE